MMVLFDGTANAPLGRQLFAAEWPHVAPRPERIAVRLYLTTPKGDSMPPQTQDVCHVLAAGPKTALEIAEALGWTIEKARRVIHHLRYHGKVQEIGSRSVQPLGKWARSVEKVYGIVADSKPVTGDLNNRDGEGCR